MISWKFVDEAPRLAQHYARRQYIYDDMDQNLQEDSVRFDGTAVVWNSSISPHGSHYSTDKTRATSEVPRYLESNPLGSSLAYCLESKVKGTLIPLWLVGSFFQFVPARVGHNAALDAAVSCLCDIYSSPYSFHKGIYQSYVRALSSLRGYLNDTSLQMNSETLCASILLQMCELVINGDREQWGHLAHGTTVLLHSRGVHRYSSAFDHAMLESQLSVIFSQSLKSKGHCFLRSPEWQALISQSPVWPFQNSQSQILALRSRLLAILVDLPSLVLYFSRTHEDQIHKTQWDEQSDSVMHKVSKMSVDIKKWITAEAEPLFFSDASSQRVIQGHTEYTDIISGVLDCVANTALLTIGNMLRFLCQARLRSSDLLGRSRQYRLGTSQLLDSQGAIEYRRQRAMRAFEFVQGESALAAKPLDFGLRQVYPSGFRGSIGIVDE